MRRVWVWSVLLVSSLVSAAPEESLDKAKSQALFAEGMELLRQGKRPLACDKFRQSYELAGGAGALLNHAVCLSDLGRDAEARMTLARGIEKVSETHPRRQELDAKLQEIEGRLAQLSLIFPVRRRPDVSIDARLLTPEEEFPQWLAPGPHQIEIFPPGRPAKKIQVVLSRGERHVAQVGLDVFGIAEPDEAPPVTPPAQGPASNVVSRPASVKPVPDAEVATSAPSLLGWSLIGVGGAGIVASGVLGGLALGQKSITEDDCDGTPICSTQAGVEANEKGLMYSTVATASFAAGAAFVGAGLYFVLTAEAAPVKASVGWQGVSLEGTF